ncbi:MAG: hypothetical protein KBS64_08100 [Treponema sp.]|nr:hypothetical protein [Candidatus Treponema equi]
MEEITDDKPIEYTDPESQELVFHHERGSFRRLENSHTRDFATGRIKTSPGFFKALVATRGNKLVFITMLMVLGVVVFLGFFKRDESDVIGGINCSLSAFSFDGQVYVTCEFSSTDRKKDDLPVDFDILYECINSDNAVADKKNESVTYVPSEKMLNHVIFTDYDLKSVKARVRYKDQEKVLSARIGQR